MMSTGAVELNIKSNSRSLPVVRGAVEQMAAMEGFTDDEAHGLILAIDEALANVIQHGYHGREDQPIAITLMPVTSEEGLLGIAVEVRDEGRQVAPETICGRPLDEVRPGGLGVHIIQSVMDEYEYSCPPEGGMRLRMVKYVTAESDSDGEASK